MKMRIREFADLTGVSVRTLHHYDKINLLKPALVDSRTSYRFYDETSLLRMQEILFLRELDIPLIRIREILSAPNYNRSAELQAQKQLLILKKERLERLISAIDAAAEGETIMSQFSDRSFESARRQYESEVREKWGSTRAYQEFEEKTNSCSEKAHRSLTEGMEQIFAGFARCMQAGTAPESADAQALAAQLQGYITEHFYTCTKEILAGLGEMYVADPRFTENLDQHAVGTADYVSQVIRLYCQ